MISLTVGQLRSPIFNSTLQKLVVLNLPFKKMREVLEVLSEIQRQQEIAAERIKVDQDLDSSAYMSAVIKIMRDPLDESLLETLEMSIQEYMSVKTLFQPTSSGPKPLDSSKT